MAARVPPTVGASRRLAVTSGLLVGVRMLTGAVGVLFLLHTGVSLRQIALLQIVFSTTVFFVEIPTGIVSDLYGRKMSVLLACSSIGVFYLLVLGTPNIWYLIPAEIFYGLGLAFLSGADRAWLAAVVSREYPGSHDRIHYYAHFETEVGAFSSMLAGPAGALLLWSFPHGGYALYVISFAFCVLLLLSFATIPDGSTLQIHSRRKTSGTSGLIFRVSAFFEPFYRVDCKLFLFYAGAVSLLAALMQPYFHFWQPLFVLDQQGGRLSLERAPILACVFFVYTTCVYVANRFTRRRIDKRKHEPLSYGAIVCLVTVLFSIGIVLTKKFLWLGIVFFSLAWGAFSVLGVIISAEFSRTASHENLATTMSTAALISRVGNIVTQALMFALLPWVELRFFFVFAALPLLALGILLKRWKKANLK